MFTLKDGGRYLANGQPVNLTAEQVYQFCWRKCRRHKVDFDYCVSRMLKMEHNSIKVFLLNLDELMYWAFFHDYDNLFAFRRKKSKPEPGQTPRDAIVCIQT